MLQGGPTFNPDRANIQLAADKASSTGMLNNQAHENSATQVIWGTNINTSEVNMKLKNFINNFEEIRDDDDMDNMDDEAFCKVPYYIQKLK